MQAQCKARHAELHGRTGVYVHNAQHVAYINTMCSTRQSLCASREACKLDAKYITNFGEEVVRGQPVFVLSILLQKLEPMLRQAAGVAPWQVGHCPVQYVHDYADCFTQTHALKWQ